jgi:ACT domain-containing protein
MSTLYEGEPDVRQSDSATLPPSLFRKRYKQLTPEEVALHDAIKDKADELARLFVQIDRSGAPLAAMLDNLAVNRGANVTLALRHLEDAVYRAVKALTT